MAKGKHSIEPVLQNQMSIDKPVLNLINDGIALIGLDGNVIDCNQTALKMLGLTKEEFIGKPIIDFLAPEDRENAFIEAQSTVRKIGKVLSLVRVQRKDNSFFPAEIAVTALYDQNKKLIGLIGVARDITERKKTEESLMESEERFRALVESTSDWIWQVDQNAVYKYVSPRVEQILGYSPEEVLGKTPFDLMPKEEAQKLTAVFEENMAKKKAFQGLENWNIHKNGTFVLLETSATPILDEGGRLIGYRGIDRDITERKKAEIALKESEELYRTLFDNSDDGFMLVEPLYTDGNCVSDIRFLKFNPAYERQTGTKAADALGRKASEVVPNLDSSVYSLIGKVLDSKKLERTEIFDKYSSKWYDAYYIPFAKGQVGILFRDITERKKAEEALAESEAKFRNLVDKLPEMVFEIDKKGHVLFANSTALQTLGYTKEELENNFDANRFVAPDYLELSKKNMKIMFEGGMRRSNEYVFIKKDGTRIPVLLTSSAIIKNKEILGARGIVVNLTERKKMEKQLEEKERLAAIGTTARMVGHDIRNPLQSMIGEIYLLKTGLDEMQRSELKSTMEESFDSMEKDILYINKIVADLQDYSKPLKPEFKSFKLSDILASVFDNVYTPDSIKISLKIYKCPVILSDPEFVRRALTNLVTNAIQAMPNGGRLEISGSEKDHYVHITVSDTGVGISEEIQSKLFTPMLTTKAKGQGLGLAVVKRLVEALNGTIRFESQEGKGTKFTIELPAQS